MILSDKRILEEIEKGTIVIEPYDRKFLGSNSYDVHLGKYLAVYNDAILDAKKHNKISHFEIPEEGYVCAPGTHLCRYAYRPANLFSSRRGSDQQVQQETKCEIQRTDDKAC